LGYRWSAYGNANGYSGEDDGGDDDDDDDDEEENWYMGRTQSYRANAAYSLYGVLKEDSKGESVEGCNYLTYINSFITNYGVETFTQALPYASDQNRGERFLEDAEGDDADDEHNGDDDFYAYVDDYFNADGAYFDDENLSVNSDCYAVESDDNQGNDDDGYTANGKKNYGGSTSYGTGCSGRNFVRQTFQGAYCDGNDVLEIEDELSHFNTAIQHVSCVQIYSSTASDESNEDENENENEQDALDLLKYSSACSLREFPRACPDPYGKLSKYTRVIERATGSRLSRATEDTRDIASLTFLIAGFLMTLVSFTLNRRKKRFNWDLYFNSTRGSDSSDSDNSDSTSFLSSKASNVSSFATRNSTTRWLRTSSEPLFRRVTSQVSESSSRVVNVIRNYAEAENDDNTRRPSGTPARASTKFDSSDDAGGIDVVEPGRNLWPAHRGSGKRADKQEHEASLDSSVRHARAQENILYPTRNGDGQLVINAAASHTEQDQSIRKSAEDPKSLHLLPPYESATANSNPYVLQATPPIADPKQDVRNSVEGSKSFHSHSPLASHAGNMVATNNNPSAVHAGTSPTTARKSIKDQNSLYKRSLLAFRDRKLVTTNKTPSVPHAGTSPTAEQKQGTGNTVEVLKSFYSHSPLASYDHNLAATSNNRFVPHTGTSPTAEQHQGEGPKSFYSRSPLVPYDSRSEPRDTNSSALYDVTMQDEFRPPSTTSMNLTIDSLSTARTSVAHKRTKKRFQPPTEVRLHANVPPVASETFLPEPMEGCESKKPSIVSNKRDYAQPTITPASKGPEFPVPSANDERTVAINMPRRSKAYFQPPSSARKETMQDSQSAGPMRATAGGESQKEVKIERAATFASFPDTMSAVETRKQYKRPILARISKTIFRRKRKDGINNVASI
jgi:hypothetical protein